MKNQDKQAGKDLYRQLRALPCAELWEVEVPRFNRAAPQERIERVSLIRAVSVVFAESGTAQQIDEARLWVRRLLHDPAEKVRRYAMAALPKLGVSTDEEADLLSLLRTTTTEREKKFLGQTLEKIGGAATLAIVKNAAGGFLQQTEQKIKARMARSQSPGGVRLDRVLTNFAGLRIHLRGRRGLEKTVRAEVEDFIRTRGKFRFEGVGSGLVVITPIAPFSLADIYALRCFGTVGFVLTTVGLLNEAESVEAIAVAITSPLSQRLFKTFTDGAIRYRLDFVARGHQRGTVRLVTNRAYALCPEILNDPRLAPWMISVVPGVRGDSVELVPHVVPDPRLPFRQQAVPAASHPPLAACMARLAGRVENEIVWDPFCGSGLELIERALLGGVHSVYGTDLNEDALTSSRVNFAAVNLPNLPSQFTCCDFRNFTEVPGLGPNSATLIITNPPLGRRVPIPDLHRLITDLLTVAATVLRPGGRLVFVNPVAIENPPATLRLESRQVVDMSGFDGRLEMYRKLAT